MSAVVPKFECPKSFRAALRPGRVNCRVSEAVAKQYAQHSELRGDEQMLSLIHGQARQQRSGN